ncbi:MAG: threonine--tRNA ligase [Phycisphaeraceae bacterium]
MRIILPDGSIKEYSDDQPVTPAQVAADIGSGLAKAAIGAKVNDQLWDLNRPLRPPLPSEGEGGGVGAGGSVNAQIHLQIITRPRLDKNNRTKGEHNPDALYLLRHSTAHVMAEAIQRLWPEAQLAYGPPLDNGFYYDIKLDKPISTDDFPRIEEEIKKIIAEDRPFSRYDLSPDEGFVKVESEDNKYKLDNARRAIDGGAKSLSWYVTGKYDPSVGLLKKQPCWEDLCMGPHVPSTGIIGAFKVMSVASSHWHGDVNSDRFQRVYGTAFFTQEDLDAHLALLDEAKQRDHRVIGQKLGLFAMDEQVGQGLILWKPRGAMVRTLLQDFLQKELLARGYDMVFTPHIGKIDLYKTSGHYPFYADSQFPTIKMKEQAGGQGGEEEYLLKPMNCPHHIKIYASDKHSYRDLPIRLAEFGTVYRFEQSGELTGMTRVRGFTQDDAHIFCTHDQVAGEFRQTIELVQFVFKTFGFDDVSIRLSLRDPSSDKYSGEPAVWDRAEAELRQVLRDMAVNFTEAVGEAAFYGPKVDFIVRDVIGRKWQLGTVQLDYNLPERFKLEYIGPDNTAHRPVMIHRAPFGSMERFMGILIEHYNGAFPLWLAPEQMRVLPISDKFNAYGQRVLAQLKDAGFRATLDESGERVQAKIKVAQDLKVPYMLVVGSRDEQGQTVSVRDRVKGDLGAMPTNQFIETAMQESQYKR